MHELTMAGNALRHVIRRTWWVPLIQGVSALVVGLLLLTRPAPTLVVLTMLLGAYWLIDGVFDALGALLRRDSDRHWLLALAAGILSAVVGFLLLTRPVLGAAVTSLTFVTFLALGAIISGILSVVWAFRVRREIHGEAWIILVGMLSILLGLMVLAMPLVSVIALVQMAAILAIVGGATGIITAFRLRSVLT